MKSFVCITIKFITKMCPNIHSSSLFMDVMDQGVSITNRCNKCLLTLKAQPQFWGWSKGTMDGYPLTESGRLWESIYAPQF